MMGTPLSRLRLIALSEGVSYVILLGIAMPLKYGFDMPQAVRVVGMLHGVFFVLFVLALAHAQLTRRWSVLFSALIFVSSLVPLGAFWMDRKLKSLDTDDDEQASPQT